MNITTRHNNKHVIRTNIIILLIVAFAGLTDAAPAKKVALMFSRPYSSGWGPVSDEDALKLAAVEILEDLVKSSDNLELINWDSSTGVFDAREAGLYFPVGFNTYAQWSSLIASDIYVELAIETDRFIWKAYSSDNENTVIVKSPFEHPKDTAAGLVNVVMKGADLSLSTQQQTELDNQETGQASLFLEWAKWIDYRPSPFHHDAWLDSRKSAWNIINNDPKFARGMAWALNTMRHKTKRMTSTPTGEEFFEHSFTVLDSPFADSIFTLVREWLDKPEKLNFALRQFELPVLELELDIGDEKEEFTTGLISEDGKTKKRLSVPGRKNLVLVLAGMKGEKIDKVLEVIAQEDENLDVRATAREALQTKKTVNSSDVKKRPSDQKEMWKEDLLTRDAYYVTLKNDHQALAEVMITDPDFRVNLAATRLVLNLQDKSFSHKFLLDCAINHKNEYIRCRALRELDKMNSKELRAAALSALKSPYWVLRLEAADILSRIAQPTDKEALESALEDGGDEWLILAFKDAIAHAQGSPVPEHIPLGLGKTNHTEGGHKPGGFQKWIDKGPKDLDKAREMVSSGYRFGSKTLNPDMPGGMGVLTFNGNASLRNIYLMESILKPLKKWRERLPFFYYIAIFDEPCGLWAGIRGDQSRAFLLSIGRPDLLEKVRGLRGKELEEALPESLHEPFRYWSVKAAADASNWVVHMFRLTAGRKYPDLNICPQTLTYMRPQSFDAFNELEADGDYTWNYHYDNFFADGSIGGINRVLRPGKPSCMITWMGWWKINVINGNTLYADTEFPQEPWRMRNYMGMRSALALWATGTEAGYFDSISMGKASDKKAQGRAVLALQLQPWSEDARNAVEILLDDPAYWKEQEGKIALKNFRESENQNIEEAEAEELDDLLLFLEDKEDPAKATLAQQRKTLYKTLMTGIGYMNLYGTDVTRAMSNLPKPDTGNRDTLIIVGRDCKWWKDELYFPIPATAVISGFDLVPNYDCIDQADLMKYDTILLKSDSYGVTTPLVKAINNWLQKKEGGLLIVSGDLSSKKKLFPMITLDKGNELFLWEDQVESTMFTPTLEENPKKNRKQKTIEIYPQLKTLHTDNKETDDEETQIKSVYSGKVTPLIKGDKGIVLARWQTPESIQNIVLFDGAVNAGPVYTEVLEEVVKAVDKERGSKVKRNPYWGHTIYENDAFVIDVASGKFPTLHEARPRRHYGVDIITGIINPEVRHAESTLILKDYVGPYAGGKGNWAVMARHELKSMKLMSEDRLEVHAAGPTRVSHIGQQTIRLENESNFEKVENQILLWKVMNEGKRAFCLLDVEGGKELHFVSSEPVVILAE